MREVLVAAVVLICPLMMLWMMRGGHGHGRQSHNDHELEHAHAPLMRAHSTKGLRELRDEIDQMIAERERLEREHSELETATGRRQ